MPKKQKKKPKTPYVNPFKCLEITKTYFDHFSIVARKCLQLIDLDPILFDSFTKKQKQDMMIAKFELPNICVKKGDSVPRQYIKFIQHETYSYLKKIKIGDQSIGLFYEDYVTMGMSFFSYVSAKCTEEYIPNIEKIKTISNRFNEYEINKGGSIIELLNFIQILTFHITKYNYRIYGFIWDGWVESNKKLSLTCPIYINSTKCESINFNYFKSKHTAYRLGIGNTNNDHPIWVAVPKEKFIKDSSKEEMLNVYVQSHAIARIRERLDILMVHTQILGLMNSILNCKLVKNNGSLHISFWCEHDLILGYLPFSILDSNVIIRSFIPLSSPNVREGTRLCKALNTNKDDIEFLRMDKLSFYQNTDFDAIPQLKDALIHAGMWHLTEIKSEFDAEKQISATQTSVISKFFHKTDSDFYDGMTELQLG